MICLNLENNSSYAIKIDKFASEILITPQINNERYSELNIPM